MAKIAVIGAGFSGLSAAAYLGKAGHEVLLFEKNEGPGGRARQFQSAGYTFDMGPSWYWMPDVFDDFFADFGHQTSDFYSLTRLDPAFEMVLPGESLRIPDSFPSLCELFETIEPGAAEKLCRFLDQAALKYDLGMKHYAQKPGLSFREYLDSKLIYRSLKLNIFGSFRSHVNRYFKDPRLRSLMEFPIMFLGATPKDTPALYSLMNYAGLKLGTWYPMGGFGRVVSGMLKVAKKNGADVFFNATVENIRVRNGQATSLLVNGQEIEVDAVLASADYRHAEMQLLEPSLRNYGESYWESRTLAPSCLIYYLGITKKLPLLHHTLFFDKDLDLHAYSIYGHASWPVEPLFYVCAPSQTDPSVAPEGHENLFLLMPIASGLEDHEQTRELYFNEMINRLEQKTGESIRPFIDYKRSYCSSDFIADYNALRGNAYGLANTLLQTAWMKPRIKNNRVSNLFYCGQLTVPGPGVPPAILSGKISADLMNNYLRKKKYEVEF